MPTVQRKKPQQYTKKTDDFYFTREWRDLRFSVLSEDPLCYYCKLINHVRAATIGDHFRPRRVFPELSLHKANIKPSCDPCHNIKRKWESKIATREQFEREISNFIESLKK
jgi:5-methylcytosine-specific restriction endonuclease McrA